MNLLDACLTKGRIAARQQRLRHRLQAPHELIRSLETCSSASALDDKARLKQRSTKHSLGLVEEA
jgi:hypothetical protein